MIDSNKITNTKIGDDIHFYVNGSEDRGIVVKMNNEYVTVFKESTQEYDDIHINDTFFIKDILINKEWDKMDDDERYDALKKIHAPSPRFIMKSWYELPKEIKELLTKNNAIETSHKEGKDDDMNNTTRVFDDSKKGFGQGELGEEGDKPKEDAGTAGEKIEGEKPKGGETESRDAGRKTQGRKTQHEHIGDEGADKFGHGKRSHSGQETPDHTRVTAGVEAVGAAFTTSGGAEQAAQDAKDEADLKDTSAVDRQIVSHGKVQGRKEQGKKGKEIKEGVAALKAWQLWLAKREQQILKEDKEDQKFQGQAADVRIGHDGKGYNSSSPKTHGKQPKGTGSPKASKDDTQMGFLGADLRETPLATGGKLSEGNTYGAGATRIEKKPSGKYEEERGAPSGTSTKKAWESWLDNKKTNSERSIHGNAAREPNSGVNTNIGFDASEDYEGFTHSGVRPEQFKHEKLKPKVTTKERINIGSTAPSHGGQGTGDGGNPHNTRQQNKDVKGRAVSGKDRK